MSGKSVVVAFRSLWSKVSSASPKEEVGDLQGTVALNDLCSGALLTNANNLQGPRCEPSPFLSQALLNDTHQNAN